MSSPSRRRRSRRLPGAGAFRRLARGGRGVAAVETALLAPALLLILLIVADGGRLAMQRATLERDVRAAALFAARSPLPLSAATLETAGALARSGDPTGAGPRLAGWSSPSASLSISTRAFDLDGTPAPIVVVAASLPYAPLLGNLARVLVPSAAFVMSATSEQPWIGL